MNVAVGPGDTMGAMPARAGGASLASAAIDTSCASCVKPHLGTVFDYAAVWTLERKKVRP
jgi:hypothetical protein